MAGALRQSLDTLRSVLRFQPVETDPVARRIRSSVSVADMRRIARRRVPRGVFDYVDGGAEDERTLRANSADFGDIGFRPRILRDVADVDPSTTLFGRPLPVPMVFSPTGFTRILCPEGELAVARAAERAGLPYTLSTLGTRSVEEVAAVNARGEVVPGLRVARPWARAGAGRPRPRVGLRGPRPHRRQRGVRRRERDHRRGFTLPPQVGPRTLLDGALHPEWTWRFVRAEPIRFANVTGRDVGDGSDAVSLHEYIDRQFDPTMSWSDLEWLRDRWSGPLIVKGIQTVDDAVLAAKVGVQAVMLSNHGGRQLDTAPTPISLVAPVTDAVGDAVEVICDGGVRRGSDIVKAVALGAKAVGVGRAYLYALGAAGERGVDHLVDLFTADIKRTMALLGVKSIEDLSRDCVTSPF